MAYKLNFGHFLLPLSMNQGPVDAKLAERLFVLRSEYLCLKKRPERHAIRNLLAMLAFRLGQFDRALEYLDKILSPGEDPDNLNALANRRYMCEDLFRVQEARECEKRIKRLLAEDGGEGMDMRCKKLRARSLAEQAFAYAFELFEESVSFGRYRKAIELYQKAVDLAGTAIDKDEMDEWIFIIGVASFIIYKRIKYGTPSEETKTRLQTAVTSFIRTVQDCQDENLVSDSWRHLGVLFKQSAEQEQTSLLPSLPDDFHEYLRTPGMCFEKAYSVSPRDPRILARYAEYCKNTGDMAKALGLVNESIQLNTTVLNLHAFCVRAYILVEQYKEQLNSFKEPSLNLLEDAERDLSITLRFFVTPWHLAAMAEVFYLKALDRQGMLKEGREGMDNLRVALTYCSKAAACHDGQKRPEVHKQRGECLCAMGEHRTALVCFKRAVECEIANQFYKGSIGALVKEYAHVLRHGSSSFTCDPPFLKDMVYWLHKASGTCLSKNSTLKQLTHLQQIPGFWKTFTYYCTQNELRDDLEYIELAAKCGRGSQSRVYRKHSYPTLEASTSALFVNRRRESFHGEGSFKLEVSSRPGISQTLDSIHPETVAVAVSSIKLDAGSSMQIPDKLSRKDSTITKDDSRKHVQPAPTKAFNQRLPNDFFVIYTRSASDWVQHSLLEELEGNRLKGCIRERDFIPGKPELTNYSDCIEGSVCTIVILTKDFEEDQTCVRGMIMAMQEGKIVIPVLRESRPLPKLLLQPYRSLGLDAVDSTLDWGRLEKIIEQQINLTT
ncbi:tetratricopeptide repeat protein 22-like [Patiria miniata]|uniref:TIR domain-containing protein n=1 Tax=Patiria miniata TaxID=46514 RepID=A0A913Z3K6_PATMI|nr:tetratricopeptide repeat protein 22-like [Patiria miniata]